MRTIIHKIKSATSSSVTIEDDIYWNHQLVGHKLMIVSGTGAGKGYYTIKDNVGNKISLCGTLATTPDPTSTILIFK